MNPLASKRSLRASALLCTLCLWLSACGYSAGLSLDGNYRSVAIEMFGNDGPLPGIERELHSQVMRSARNMLFAEIEDVDTADVIIRGRIRRYSTKGGLRTGGNRLRTKGVRLVAEAELWTAAGQMLRGPISASISVAYLNGPLAADEEARKRAMKNVADLLLLKLLVPRPKKIEPPA